MYSAFECTGDKMNTLQRVKELIAIAVKERAKRVRLMHGDCLVKMKDIASGSVDMVMTDPPYGTTNCEWNNIIDLKSM